MPLPLNACTSLTATRVNFELFDPALRFVLTSGLKHIYGSMASVDDEGNVCGVCVVGAITEGYHRSNDPHVPWTCGHGRYDTNGNGLPDVVMNAYGLERTQLLVDLRALSPVTQRKLEDEIEGRLMLSTPIVNIIELNDARVSLELLVDVLREGLEAVRTAP